MLFKYFLLLVLVQSCLILAGQEKTNPGFEGRIIGKVIDSTNNNPLSYATISLYVKDSSKVLTGTTTNSNGIFRLTGIAPGIYTVVIEFQGFHPKTIRSVGLQGITGSRDLKTIFLSPSATDLKGIIISGRKPTVENKIDRIVFNAEKDITSQGGVATDILRKVPQVSVGVDGTVELLGSSAIRFLINGKPSTIFGSNITDVLQSIPASQIKSIEVITNPGARYEAQGLGGIINIILKQNSAKGTNGNLSLTAGTRTENGSLNLSARNGNFGVNAFVNGNITLQANTTINGVKVSQDSLQHTEVTLTQDGSSAFTRNGYSSGVGFDWIYKKKNSFSGALNYFHFGNSGEGYRNQTQVTNETGFPGNNIAYFSGINRYNNSFHSETVDVNFNYKRTFEKKEQELEISLNTSHGKRNNQSYSNQFLMPEDSLYYGTDSRNPGNVNENLVQLNYTHPLKHDMMAGMGGEIVFNNINSNTSVYLYDPASGNFGYDSLVSNSLQYHQKVYAAYTELSFPIAHFLTAKTGLRYERTDIQSFYSNAQQQDQVPGYNTLVPSIFFSRKISENITVKLSYTKRIERPDYGELNPYINTSDPKNITKGNPYLLPEIGNRFELSFNKDLGKSGSFIVTLFHRINHNDIQPFIVYYPSLPVGDTVFKNVFVTTPQNIGIEKNTGVNFFGELNANSNLSFRSNIVFFYRHTINQQDPGYNSSSFNYRLNLNGTYKFNDNLACEFFGSFSSARHEAQGKYPSFTNYSVAVRKQFWSKKGSLALSLINPINEYVKQKTELFGPNFTSTSTRKIPYRSISLNFTWKFGKLEFKKEKEEKPEQDNQASVNG